MRSFLFALGFCGFAFLCGTSSCQKTSNYIPSVVATLDSLPFIANGTAEVFCDSTADSTGMVHVHGYSYLFTPGTSSRPSLALNMPRKVGAYTIGNGCSATLMSYKTGSGSTVADSGFIAVESVSGGIIEGTFSFTCQNGQQVSKGQFYAHLPK